MQQFVNPLWSKQRRRNLRQRQTKTEELLWNHLRNRRCGGIKFRRQVGIGGYIPDFYAHEYKLIVETDGPIHDSLEARVYDRARDNYFKAAGLRTLRFKNAEVWDNITGVLQRIQEFAQSHHRLTEPAPPSTFVEGKREANCEPSPMFFDNYSKVHCIGIGGIGISAVAKFLQAHGKIVTGSDATESLITIDLEHRGISVAVGHDAKNIADDVDLIVYTEAAGETNPERAEATRRGLPQLGHFDFLGELSKEYKTICVTGTNGKSTTTAMTGLIFQAAGLDPTVFVGSLVPGWVDGNLRIGKSDILIIEGDEYKQKMVKLFPATTVITNIEKDHLDVYRDLDHIIDTFREVAEKTTGNVFANAEDINAKQLSAHVDATFGTSAGAQLVAQDRRTESGKQTFTVVRNGAELGVIELKVPGAFNMMNALAATAVALDHGIPFNFIQTALAEFHGIWRRFERVGEFNGAIVISDYGHHPTAIKGTLEAAKEFFPGRRLVLLFEPHQHSRTKELFAEFVKCFDVADRVILSEIYLVAGRLVDKDEVSSLDLVKAIDLDKVTYAKDLNAAEADLRSIIEPNDVVIVMGAGDVDKVARNLTGKE